MRRQRVSSLVSSRLVSSALLLLLLMASWGCLLGLNPSLLPRPASTTLRAVFISFHFVRGLELNLLENASNSKFYEFTTFRFLLQPSLSLRSAPLPTPLLRATAFRHFFYPPALALGVTAGRQLSGCVCVMCKCNRKAKLLFRGGEGRHKGSCCQNRSNRVSSGAGQVEQPQGKCEE